MLLLSALLSFAQGGQCDEPARLSPPDERSLDVALELELLAMCEVDQRARHELINEPASEEILNRVVTVDRAHRARMKEILAKHGWPGKALVGNKGAHAAWLLVQHADEDVPFQVDCLALLESAVKQGEASAADWAYLVDRVRVNQKQAQLFGTQFRPDADGNYQPQPIEDESQVDLRRKSVGLGTMAEYAAQLRKPYGPKPPTAVK
ncbi:MAG: DUF6624 domain-containing protein [Pirellulales bacterium]